MSRPEPNAPFRPHFAGSRSDLSQDEERRLARRARQGDQKAFERLVESQVFLAYAIAREFRSYGLPADELVSEAILGVVRAARDFDPERGTRLATYAAWWIRAAVRRYTLENRRIVRGPNARSARRVLAGLTRTERALAQLRGERPSAEAVAQALGVAARDVEEMRSVFGARDVAYGVATDGRPFESASTWRTPEEMLGDAEERHATADRVRAALARLDPRARRVLEGRCLADEAATLAEMSDELGVSRERVRQIEVAAKARIRDLCA